jgi:transcriptional regulator with XRE-family HTH domain
MTFQEKLVVLRKIKSLTQDEFASAVGVSRQAVYKWESGQSYPEVAKLIEIKMLFGISIDDLLDDTYDIALPEKKRKKRITHTEKERIEKEVRAEMQKEETEEIKPFQEEFFEKENSVPEEQTNKENKRVGFFGKLFGKK